MAYEITHQTGFYREPARSTANFIMGFASGIVLAFAGKTTDDGWVKVHDPGSADVGWIMLANAKVVDDSLLPAPPPVDPEGFVSICLIAERVLNGIPDTEPWFVSADFLIARALIETGMANLTNAAPQSDGIGPLRVTTAEWARFIANAGDYRTSYPQARPRVPTVQVRAAAWTMHVDAKAISDAKNAADVAANARTAVEVKQDPFVPSFLDLLHAYLTGSATAAVAILDADPQKTLATVLTGMLSANQVGELFAGRSGFNNAPVPATVGGFVDATRLALNKALKDAFVLIQTHSPEDIPKITTGPAPWLAPALTEKAATVTEPNPRILSYFNHTDLRPLPTSTDTAWCGAFAAYCMKASQNPTVAASIPKGAAAAVSWKNWGTAIDMGAGNVPAGAVVVLSKDADGKGSGHVGFFVDFDNGGKKVKLLGGNQSNMVTETSFDVTRIAAIRWLDIAPARTIANDLRMPSGILATRHQYADMIVNAFATAGFGKIHQIAAVANAIAESRLDPDIHVMPEDSVGLFQLRRIKGVGKNYSVAELQDPSFNIQLILAEAKKYPSFINATTLARAVYEFVRWVERPKDAEGQAEKRLQIALKL